jgi:hypothetical protein
MDSECGGDAFRGRGGGRLPERQRAGGYGFGFRPDASRRGVYDNVASGRPADVYLVGSFQATSGAADYSGYLGQLLYVGRSGQIVTSSGSFNSGGLLSGDITQAIGVATNSGAAVIGAAASLPFVASLVYSGSVASGNIGWPHLSVDAVRSGHIGSGAVLGQAGGGSFSIASGTIGTNNIGSGAIVSGLIASGQVGTNHLSSGCVVSGRIASGQIGTNHFTSGAIITYGRADVENAINCQEPVSGLNAVCVTMSSTIALAMAGSGLRLPAVGVVFTNVASGSAVTVILGGKYVPTTAGWAATWSGFTGKPLYVGSGGIVVTQSGLLSGMGVQRLGVAVSGGIIVNPDVSITSGVVASPPGSF